MKLPIVLGFCIALSQAAVVPICEQEIGNYLNCMTNAIDNPVKSQIHINEYVKDFQVSAGHSFDQTVTAEQGSKITSQKCVWDSAANLNQVGDFFAANGPLQGSQVLYKAATHLRDYLFTNENVETKTCLRRVFYDGLYNEIKGCVGQKLGVTDFKFPTFPLYDRTAQTYSTQVLQAVNNRAWVYNELHTCHQQSTSKAQYTENLLKLKSGQLYKLHCEARQTCIHNLPSQCNTKMSDIKQASCSCVKQMRDGWRQNFLKARDAINKFDDQTFCVNKLQKGIGGWHGKWEMINSCIKTQDNPFVSIQQDLAVEKACARLKDMTVGQRIKALDAVQGFHSFLDAVNDGFIRYCDATC